MRTSCGQQRQRAVPGPSHLAVPSEGTTGCAGSWCLAGSAGGSRAGQCCPFPEGWRGVGFLYKAPRGWRGKAALGSSSVRALCCRGENGFSPDPVSALGLFEVTMCFSSPVQQSPGRLQKECSICGQQQILSPVQGSELRSLSRQGCGSRGLAGNGHAEMERGERCVQSPPRPSGDKTLVSKCPVPRERGCPQACSTHCPGAAGGLGLGLGLAVSLLRRAASLSPWDCLESWGSP